MSGRISGTKRRGDAFVSPSITPEMQSTAELDGALDNLTISPDSAPAHPSDKQQEQPPQDARETSREDVWYLKTIEFTSPFGTTRSYNIITQNYNGCVLRRSQAVHRQLILNRPCSFIAICNILILREQIEILPRDRKSVSYEFLAQLLGEHILLTAPEVDVSAALSMMPLTTSEFPNRPPSAWHGLTWWRSSEGMDLNPVFTSATAFRPATTGGELMLFASAGITLVHGWLVDPASTEYAAVSRVGDYDSAVNLIVEADVLTRGLLVGDGDAAAAGPSSSSSSPPNINLTDEERRKVEDGEQHSTRSPCNACMTLHTLR